VPGRAKAYEAIIKGESITKINLPESFNVLVRELKGLALDVELQKRVEGEGFASVDETAIASEKAADEPAAAEVPNQ